MPALYATYWKGSATGSYSGMQPAGDKRGNGISPGRPAGWRQCFRGRRWTPTAGQGRGTASGLSRAKKNMLLRAIPTESYSTLICMFLTYAPMYAVEV